MIKNVYILHTCPMQLIKLNNKSLQMLSLQIYMDSTVHIHMKLKSNVQNL